MGRKEFVEATKETLKHSTFHGVRNIIRHQFKLVKFMWLICFVCSASYFFYDVIGLISSYLEYPVETKIEVRQMNEINFPLVKICRGDLNVPGAKSGSPTSDHLLYLSLQNYFKNLYKSNGEAFQKTLGIKNLSDILISCIYNFNYCNASEFSYFYDFSFGSCWLFNSGRDSFGNKQPIKIATSTGIANGLSVELYLGNALENNNLFSTRNSFEILIANETADSSLKIAIKLLAGFSTHLIFDKYLIKLYPKPYTNCVNNLISEEAYSSECYRKTLHQAQREERSYHYADCSYMCLQKLVTETCNCTVEISDSFYPDIRRKCIQATDIPCLQKSYAEFLNNKTHMDLCDCPRECTEVGYHVTNSLANYPTKYGADLLAEYIHRKFSNKSEIAYKDVEKRIASAHIYLNDLRVMTVIQKPKMVIFDLIAQIGSQMFIFMGTSFLFVGELLEIIIQNLLICFTSNKI